MVIPRVKTWLRPEAHSQDTAPPLFASTNRTLGRLALLLGLIIVLFLGVQVARSASVSVAAIVGVEALYALCLVAMALTRMAPDQRVVLLSIFVTIITGAVLMLSFADWLGYSILELLTFFIVFRLPGRLSMPILVANASVFAIMIIAQSVLSNSTANLSNLWTGLPVMLLVGFLGATLRSRAVLIAQLRASQAQLQAEMEHTAELAAARERARIARDMHDVLAHSLTVLSIQTQAVRQIVTRQPEQAALMLDEMAGVLRESIAESRRVVAQLREATHIAGDAGPLGSRLLALADRFAERSGVTCSLRETGPARDLEGEQESALQFALQEALTNAYQHGGAQHVWAELVWQPEAVRLSVHDDGTDQPDTQAAGKGGNGLRGMRERATALGGCMHAGPRDGGGYAVSVTLPLAVVETVKSGVLV